MRDIRKFIAKETQQLNAVRSSLSAREAQVLLPRVRRIQNMLNLLQRNKTPQNQKHLKTIESENDNIALSASLLKNVTKSAVRHGHAQAVADRLSYEEGSEPIPVTKNLYTTDTTQVPQSQITRQRFLPNPFNESNTRLPDNMDVEDLSLSDDEVDEIKNATPFGRHKLVKQYENETNDAIEEYDNNRLNSAGIGLASGFVANKAVDIVDPNKKIPAKPRTGIKGALGGVFAEGLTAGTEATTTGLVESGFGGAAGAIAGEDEYKYLKKKGVNELQSEVGAGAYGGATFGTASVPRTLAGAIASGATEGAEGGLLEGAQTAGTSIAFGALGGAILGAGAYEISKLYHSVKDDI